MTSEQVQRRWIEAADRKRSLSLWRAVGLVASGSAVLLGLGMFIVSTDTIFSTRGLQMGGAGLKLDSLAILLLLCAIGLALLVGGLLQLARHREWRKLESKYSGPPP